MPKDGARPPPGINLREFIDEECYSDLSIRDSEGSIWAAHRIVVCGQSPILANACKPEHGFKESLTGVIELPNDDPAAVAAMLEFLYSGSYTPSKSAYPLLLSAQAYVMGDIYQIPRLKLFARETFLVTASPSWNEVEFADAVNFIYGNTPDEDKEGIRSAAVEIVTKHFHDLVQDSRFGAVLDKHGALATEVLRNLARLNPHGFTRNKYSCCKQGHNNAHIVELDIVDMRSSDSKTTCPSCDTSRTNRAWEKRLI